MEVKIGSTTSLHWSAIPQRPSLSQNLTATKRRRSSRGGGDVSLACQTRLRPCIFLGTQSGKLHRSKSSELSKVREHNPLRRVCSASSDFFSDQDFSVKMHELALQLERNKGTETVDSYGFGSLKVLQESVPWMEMVNHSSIERKANSVHLPLSLRLIQRKLQEVALKEATECSIHRAFSSMVFMIGDLHTFAFHQDLRGIKKDMHASFAWIFQRLFSQTPTLMLYVMIMLANFTVHSVASNLPLSAGPMEPSPVTKGQGQTPQRFDFSSLKDSTVAVGLSGTRPINFDKASHFSTQGDSISAHGVREEELSLWNSMVEEADQMQDSPVDRDTRSRLVSSIIARIELDDHANYSRTELLYKIGLAQEPNNPLLLANYAQFLYLVAQDYDRAEKCFKKAIESEEVDAEAYSKFAIFQWKVRKDLWAAEELFLEAISADPTNSFYAANYANFLWQTGGEETCYPIESSEYPQEMA